MKLVLVCTAVVLLMSAVELARPSRRKKNTIEQIFREANVTPVPEEKVELCYEDCEVTLGMQVRPEDVQGLPFIRFEFGADCYYTVIIMTLDAPSPDNPFLSPYLLGMYVNNYENSDGYVLLEESCEIAPLLGPSPPPGTGLHRYVLYVYKQNGIIDTSDEDLCRYQTALQYFSLCDFEENYDLISPPAGGIVFYSKYPYSED